MCEHKKKLQVFLVIMRLQPIMIIQHVYPYPSIFFFKQNFIHM